MQMAPSQMVCFQRRPGEKEGLSRVRGWWLGDPLGNLTFTFPLCVLLPSHCPEGGFPLGIPHNHLQGVY